MSLETLTFTAAELDALLEKRRLHDIEEANRRANASWTLMCEKMVVAEREACARLCVGILEPKNCDTREKSLWFEALEECAAAIRARGQTIAGLPVVLDESIPPNTFKVVGAKQE